MVGIQDREAGESQTTKQGFVKHSNEVGFSSEGNGKP